MRNIYNHILRKEFVTGEQILRKQEQYTRAKMAEKLHLDPRSLTYLENETSTCSAVTLILFLRELDNADDFLNEIWKKFDEVDALENSDTDEEDELI